MDTKVIVIIVLAAIVLVGGFFAYRQFKNNKRDSSFATILFSSGMLLITSASSSALDKILVALGIIVKYENPTSLEGDFNIFYFVFGCILVVLAIGLWLYGKKKLYVLNINGYSRMRLESYIPEVVIQNSDFKEREIDFVNIYRHLFSANKDVDSFECIKSEIKDKVEAFKSEANKIPKGYTGIAPIPFIMYAGTFMDRVKIDEYYEYDKVEAKTYYTLKDKSILSKYPVLKDCTNHQHFDENKNELVVAVSLTQQIVDSQMTQFLSDCNVVKFEIERPIDNAIRYKQQLNEYVNLIISTFEELSKKHSNITRIHFIYSGQSCLAFEIGKRCVDSTRIPQIISYQFENQNQNIKYPWGIVINGLHKGNLVKAQGGGC